MFKNLTKFEKRRTTNQAIGFYIAYLVAIILVALIGAAILGTGAATDEAFLMGARIGINIAILATLVLSYLVIKGRKLSGDLKYILIGLLAGALAYYGGALVGLIPVAYLTTVKK